MTILFHLNFGSYLTHLSYFSWIDENAVVHAQMYRITLEFDRLGQKNPLEAREIVKSTD